MGVRRSEERLAEAAKLYYVDELNQEEVASALGTTRSNVSRMLQAARRQGIIKFHVTHPLTRQSAMEERLADTFGLDEAVVLSADTGVHALERTGELAARWVASQVSDGQTLALSWGRTLKAMVEQLEVDRSYDVTVVQIAGDLGVDPRVSGHELVRDMATRLGGEYSYMHAPGILGNPETVASLRSIRDIAEHLERATKADMAIVGLGGFGKGFATHTMEGGYLSSAEREELESLSPAGEIAGRFFDIDGREVGPLQDRVLGLTLEELRKIPTVVGLAAGPQKARGLWGALRGGLVDVAICDQSAAAAAMHMQREAS